AAPVPRHWPSCRWMPATAPVWWAAWNAGRCRCWTDWRAERAERAALACERVGSGHDLGLGRNHQERRARARGEGIGAPTPPHRFLAEARLGDRGDDALADAGTASALVDHQDAGALAGMARDGGFVERQQPAQVDHAHLPAARRLDGAGG